MIRRHTLLDALLLLPLVMRAQDGLPIRVTLFSESTAMPFDKAIATPLHPGMGLGTEFHWKESRHFRLYPMINIGYMFHKKLFQGLYASLELGFDLKFGFGLNLKSSLGLGYLLTFSTQQEFQFEEGRFQQGPDMGNSRIMPSLGLGLGYRLSPSHPNSTELFVMNQTWLEYPYSPDFIPVMPHSNVQLGLKFYALNGRPAPSKIIVE